MTFRRLRVWGMLMGLVSVGAMAYAADGVVLFDFEDPAQLDRFAFNTPAGLTTEWASEGSSSLKVEFKAHVSGETPDFPNAACWGGGIRVRDWREYKYYCFDIYIPAEETYVGIIVQRSGTRRDRMDRRYLFPRGAHRMWINIPNFITKEGDIETVSDITELEFFQSKPHEAGAIYIDNIRIMKSYDGEAGVDADLWVETLNDLAANPPVEETDGPALDRVESLSASPADPFIEREKALSDIAGAVKGRAASQSLAAAVEAEFAETGYGVMVAPVGEHVFFSGQPVKATWSRTLDMDLLRGEARSAQLVVFPKPGETLTDVRIDVDALTDADGHQVAADCVSTDLVGYVELSESVMHQFRGFTDYGWYPDPVLSLTKPFDVTPPRELQPALITVRAPRDIPAGTYTGKVTVSAAGRTPCVVDMTITIHDATVPVAPSLPHLIHGGIDGFCQEFRLNPNNGDLGDIYRWGSALDPDTIAEHVDQGMNRFNLLRMSQFNLAGRCGKHGEEAGARQFVNMVAGLYTDEVMAEFAKRNLLDKAVFYGFDEVHTDDPVWRQRMINVFGGVKERYGKYGVKTATTARPWFTPDVWDLPVDIWIPLLREYDPVLADMARQRGIEVWWYSIGWEIYNAPGWSKAMCWAGFANKVDGWLYYHLYDWVNRNQRLSDENPMTAWSPLSEQSRGSFGTGAVVYFDADGNPRPSLRLVNLREGMYDYDLLCLLRDRVAEVEKAASADDFETQAALARARDLLAAHWRSAVTGYVLEPSREAETTAAGTVDDLRTEALALLDALSPRTTLP